MIESRFTTLLELWFNDHCRSLPWRGLKDPYLIWISEIILQQTRIAQGMEYYQRFVERWPDVQSLAKAKEDEVLKMWEGLGYYSRARNLHEAAKSMAEAGGFPHNYDEVRALKGVGDYTAAAVCSMAYNLPYAALDGNAFRVLGRVFGIEEAADSATGKKVYKELASELLDKKRPGLFNQAMMDFGALQCIPKNPHCMECPLAAMCEARAQGRVDLFPVKEKRPTIKERHFNYYWIEWRGKVLLRRREGKDIWRGLYEPFLCEENGDLPETFGGRSATCQMLKCNVKHVLTHRVIWANFFQLRLPSEYIPHEIPEGYRFFSPKETEQMAFPELVRKNMCIFEP